MCGRYTLTAFPVDWAEKYRAPDWPVWKARYNIAPSQLVPVVRRDPESPAPILDCVQWGLVPFWTKDPATSRRSINARAETAAQKPSFRAAMRHRRCLIPADGFYEWAKRTSPKQPHYFQLKSEKLFAFAGLYEHWEDKAGAAMLDTCAILTTRANELLRPIHDRMPVILPERAHERWLDAKVQSAADVQDLLAPFPADRMQVHPVGLHVNSPRNDDPRCIARISPS